MDKVHVHGPLSRFVNAAQELVLAHYLRGLDVVKMGRGLADVRQQLNLWVMRRRRIDGRQEEKY